MSALEDMLREIAREVVREELGKLATKPDQYLSTADAAKLAAVAPRTITRWLAEGLLTKHRAGREVRVLRSELEGLMRAGRSRSTRGRDLSDREIDAMAARDIG